MKYQTTLFRLYLDYNNAYARFDFKEFQLLCETSYGEIMF